VNLISVLRNSPRVFTSSPRPGTNAQAILYFGVDVTEFVQFRCQNLRSQTTLHLHLVEPASHDWV